MGGSGSFDHQNFGVSYFSFSDLAALAADTRRMISETGVSLHPASRIARQLDDVEAMVNFLLDQRPTLKLSSDADYAISDLDQLHTIMRWLRGPHEDQGIRELVAMFLQDAASPYAAAETPGRDAQFELLVAAACRRATYLIRRIDPPDFVITPLVGKAGSLGELGLAVKRVKKEKQLQKRLREANDQLSRTHPGIIAVDVSMLVNPSGQLLNVLEGDAGIDQVAWLVDQYLEPRLRTLATCVDPRSTLGVLFYASLRIGRQIEPELVMPWGNIGRWMVAPVHPRYVGEILDLGARIASPNRIIRA